MQGSQRCTRRLTSTHIIIVVFLGRFSSRYLYILYFWLPQTYLSIFHHHSYRSETKRTRLTKSSEKQLDLYNVRCKTTRPAILKRSCAVAKATCHSIYAASSVRRKCHIIIITRKEEITTTPAGRSTHNRITIIQPMTGNSSHNTPTTTNNDNERPYPRSQRQPPSHHHSGIHNPSSKPAANYDSLQANAAYRL
jgi:hypothetical protein